MTRFETAREVIEELGKRLAPGLKIEGRPVRDTGAFAAWWFRDDPVPIDLRCKRVSHWKVRGFPPNTFVVMSSRLAKEHKIQVSPTAWGMEVPSAQRRRAA